MLASRRVAFMLAVVVLLALASCWGRPGAVVARWEESTDLLRVRFTCRREEGASLPGAYYSLQVRPAANHLWRDVLTFREDDEVPMPPRPLHVIDERTVSACFGDIYAVTQDAGATWHFWNARDSLRTAENEGSYAITRVQVSPDGMGTMEIRASERSGNSVMRLTTETFGIRWTRAN